MSTEAQNDNGTLFDCVATPEEMQRTAMRVLLLILHIGLSAASAKVRRSIEARRASQVLYSASCFFNREYDPARLDAELRQLTAVLVPLAAVHGCDPFALCVYASGDLKPRRSRRRRRRAPPLLHQW